MKYYLIYVKSRQYLVRRNADDSESDIDPDFQDEEGDNLSEEMQAEALLDERNFPNTSGGPTSPPLMLCREQVPLDCVVVFLVCINSAVSNLQNCHFIHSDDPTEITVDLYGMGLDVTQLDESVYSIVEIYEPISLRDVQRNFRIL